jgi:uncharacterized protein YbaR (Trm112 family)
MLDKELRDVLACPRCKDHSALSESEDELTCPSCGSVFPIKNGIPCLIGDKDLTSEEIHGDD